MRWTAAPTPVLREKLKTFAQSGIVRFDLPEHWESESGDDGNTAHWDPEGVGTLRLSLVTARREPHGSSEPALEFLRSYEKALGAVHELPSGCAFQEYRRESAEKGEPTETYFFEVAHFVAPHFFRLAMFSYTRWAASLPTPAALEELNLVRQQVVQATFSPQPAEWE